MQRSKDVSTFQNDAHVSARFIFEQLCKDTNSDLRELARKYELPSWTPFLQLLNEEQWTRWVGLQYDAQALDEFKWNTALSLVRHRFVCQN